MDSRVVILKENTSNLNKINRPRRNYEPIDTKRSLKRALIEEETIAEIEAYNLERKKMNYANLLESMGRRYANLKDFKTSFANFKMALDIKKSLAKNRDTEDISTLYHSMGTNYYSLTLDFTYSEQILINTLTMTDVFSYSG